MSSKSFQSIFLFICFLCCFSASSQQYVSAYGNVVAQVSQQRILENLQQFEGFGEKFRGTVAQANTLQWLKNKYASFGYSASQIVEDPFSYAGTTCKNLIVTKTGTLYPNTYVIVCGHYDTLNGPGTNDNGSGVSVILEVARLLKNFPTEYSIKFINFSGEEDGLVGSEHYVNEVVNGSNLDIRLVINLDQIGGVAGQTNNTITCERDQSNSPTSNNALSSTMTNQLRNCVELYSTLETVIGPAYGSDYVPFEDNGEIITGLYEFNESPYPHTENDVLANMDPVFVYKVAQAATGAVMHFALACTTCTLAAPNFVTEKIEVFPNPFTDVINISGNGAGFRSVSLFDITGKVLYSFENQNASDVTVPTGAIPAGVYFVKVESASGTLTRRIVKY